MDELDIQERGRIGNGGVAAVQDADLHEFEGSYILDELNTNLLQCGPACRKMVFKHPLPEVFAEHWPGIDDAMNASQ